MIDNKYTKEAKEKIMEILNRNKSNVYIITPDKEKIILDKGAIQILKAYYQGIKCNG